MYRIVQLINITVKFKKVTPWDIFLRSARRKHASQYYQICEENDYYVKSFNQTDNTHNVNEIRHCGEQGNGYFVPENHSKYFENNITQNLRSQIISSKKTPQGRSYFLPHHVLWVLPNIAYEEKREHLRLKCLNYLSLL